MKISLSGDITFFERFQNEAKKEVETAMRDSVDTIQATVRNKLREKRLINTGNLFGSIQKSVTFTSNKALGIVGSNAIYVLPMEYGITKRFYPSKLMIQSLTLWASQKLQLGAKEAAKAGAAIAWKIARKGLDKTRFPSHFFEEGYRDSIPLVARIFDHHIQRAAELAKNRSK